MSIFRSGLLFLPVLYQYVFLQATSAEVFIQTDTNSFIRCTGFTGFEPMSCSAPIPQSTLFPGVTGTPLKTSLQNCDGSLFFYTLFDSTPDQIYRLPESLTGTPFPILDTTEGGFTDITSFDLCCDKVFFSNGDEVYVQKIVESGPVITKSLVQASDTITHVEVLCNPPDEYYVFHFIDLDGLFRTSMEGGPTIEIVSFESGGPIGDFDFHPETSLFAFGRGQYLNVYNYRQAIDDGDAWPRSISTLPVWMVNVASGVMARAVSIGSVAGSDPLAPIVYMSWTNGDLTYATGSGPLNTVTSISQNVADLFICIEEADCSIGCLQCPCDECDGFQDCCNGRCIPTNCACGGESLSEREGCPYPLDCPLDLIGAVKCQGSIRGQSTSIYALSSFSRTSICATDAQGKDVPITRAAIPISTASSNSVGYKFPGRKLGKKVNGDRYGAYVVQTSSEVEGLSGSTELVNSLAVIMQERNNAITAKYVTVTAPLGSKTSIRVYVSRYCNIQRIRWKKNGYNLTKYKGKWTIPFTDVMFSDEGIYEAYFRGRYKSNWRRIVRLLVSLNTCHPICRANGGVCSYNGNCICPPGKAGSSCQDTCPKGTFGLRGGCTFDCGVEFGTDFADCQHILLCMEDPSGCRCYPGHYLPNCAPCKRGFWGQNCENVCTCTSGGCDSFDGSCLI